MKTYVRRGFTLPEILVTVTVVAVLAAVVVPAVTQYAGKGDSPATQQDLNSIRNSITSYSVDTRAYPTTFYDLLANPNSVNGWKGPYTTVTLVGVTGAGTFTSTGLNLKLGPAIDKTTITGMLSTPVAFIYSGTTCQDLWNLDKAIDGGSGLSADALTMSTSGALTWGTACNGTAPTLATSPTTTVSSLRLALMAIGQ